MLRCRVLYVCLTVLGVTILLSCWQLNLSSNYYVDEMLTNNLLYFAQTFPFKDEQLSEVISISNSSYPMTCPVIKGANLVYIQNKIIPKLQSSNIPLVVHQTSKSRCLTSSLSTNVKKWQDLQGFSYIFHDDEAVMRLFQQEYSNFPHLREVVQHCMLYGTVRADLWRYIVLWRYGGVYADIDSAPARFSLDSLLREDDAFFVVEQYHVLSQYFMAVSPQHPILEYAIKVSIANLLRVRDTSKLNAALVTGPHALHQALRLFVHDHDGSYWLDPLRPGYKPVKAGVYIGTNNRTIRVVGQAEHQNEYVLREVLNLVRKRRAYSIMGMQHFRDDMLQASGTSCQTAIKSAAVTSFKP